MALKDQLEHIFSNDYPGTEAFVDTVIKPIFGDDISPVNTDLAEVSQYADRARKAGIKHIQYIGDLTEQNYNADNIVLLDVTVDDSKNIERSRVNIQQLIRSIAQQHQHLLIVFHYENVVGTPWRFSYAYKAGSIADTTSAKRYTYVFGRGFRGRTAAERFAILAASPRRNQDFIDAFSVEALSNDFFDGYRELYADFVQFITGKRYEKVKGKYEEVSKHAPDPQFESTFESNAKQVRDYVKKMFGRIVFLYFLQRKGWLYDNNGASNPHYMHDLFANSKYKDNFLDGCLEHLFFYVLNTDKEHRTAEAYALPGGRLIPYLNGGLFERDDIDALNCVFPANYFKRLFDFLDRYNFTIDENDTEDAEIGIDPEMLGRIFENLLEDNKDKGAFYTPKEIVDYMCRESIIAYLQNDASTDDGRELIRRYIETLDIDILNERQREFLEKKLLTVKICDPAIGSGAFPMGLVNLLSKIFISLRTYSTIDQAKMKRYIMQQSIYGVDIEQGAVDIARLRFWLAMVVDEDEPMPLPNLHFKIMQGNSLLETYKGLDLKMLIEPDPSRIDFISEAERQQLQTDLRFFYAESDHTRRAQLMTRIKHTVMRMINNADPELKFDGLDVSSNNQFFLWHTWFADVFENGGFDIVIGNPPYIDSETMTKTQPEKRELYAKKFKFAKGNWDIYILFYELGLRLLTQKGILSYIVPNKWLSIGYGKILRTETFEKLCTICDCRGVKIFDAGNEPIISIMCNSPHPNITIGKVYKGKEVRHIATVNKEIVDKDNIGLCIAPDIELLLKIKGIGGKVSDVASVENPFSTSEAYDLIPLINENEFAIDYKLINTGTIDPYINLWGKSKTAYLKNKYQFPQVDKVLFAAQFPRRTRQVESAKIVISGMRHFESFLDIKGSYVAGKSTIIVLNPSVENALIFLQGLFNSKLMKFYIYQSYSTLGIGGGINFSKDMVSDLPIPKLNYAPKIIELVNSITNSIAMNEEFDSLPTQDQIDHIVYHLYNLTYDEVLIVDPETPITREEYENFKFE